MKKILITQRIDQIKSHNEERDSLDKRWVPLLLSVGLLPIIIPNNHDYLKNLLTKLNFLGESSGLIISGGQDNTIRNDIETKLLQWAIEANKPVLGVCHGMQLIQCYFNNSIYKVDNHVNVEHNIITKVDTGLNANFKKFKRETLYHNYGTNKATKPLEMIAKSSDGIIIAVKHQSHSIYGVMWHPERSSNIKLQQQLLRDIF